MKISLISEIDPMIHFLRLSTETIISLIPILEDTYYQ